MVIEVQDLLFKETVGFIVYVVFVCVGGLHLLSLLFRLGED